MRMHWLWREGDFISCILVTLTSSVCISSEELVHGKLPECYGPSDHYLKGRCLLASECHLCVFSCKRFHCLRQEYLSKRLYWYVEIGEFIAGMTCPCEIFYLFFFRECIHSTPKYYVPREVPFKSQCHLRVFATCRRFHYLRVTQFERKSE